MRGALTGAPNKSYVCSSGLAPARRRRWRRRRGRQGCYYELIMYSMIKRILLVPSTCVLLAPDMYTTNSEYYTTGRQGRRRQHGPRWSGRRALR